MYRECSLSLENDLTNLEKAQTVKYSLKLKLDSAIVSACVPSFENRTSILITTRV
jgi:hypothetical protein